MLVADVLVGNQKENTANAFIASLRGLRLLDVWAIFSSLSVLRVRPAFSWVEPVGNNDCCYVHQTRLQ